MKVLFPFVGDSVGGSHNSIIELHKELTNNNVHSIILVHRKGPLSSYLDSIGIKYSYLSMHNFAGESPNFLSILYNILINFNKISKYIKKNKFSIVHGNDLRINLTWSLPTKLSKASYVWHQRTIMSPSLMWRVTHFLSDYFIAISNVVYKSLPSNVPECKKYMLLNPFDIGSIFNKFDSKYIIRLRYSIPHNSFIMGYVGRLVDWKNVDFLIKCFSKYSKKRKNIYLLIVGTGKDEYVSLLKKQVQLLGIETIVIFAGFSSKVNEIIAGLDIMVAPSNQEPFGRTLVESMIQKTPVLAAMGGGHLEIIENGVTGRLYEHENIDDFIVQVDAFFFNNKLTKGIVEQAYINAINLYSSSKHFNNIMPIYKQLNNV